MWRWWVEQWMNLWWKTTANWKKGFTEAYAFFNFVLTCVRRSWRNPNCVLFFPLQWSPLILNPSYTILHFLGATKVVSQHGAFFSLAYIFQMVLAACVLMSLHFSAYHFEMCICCFRATGILNSLLTAETFPTTLSSLGRKLLGKLGCANGRLPSPHSKVEKTCMALCKHAVSCCFLGLSLYYQWL